MNVSMPVPKEITQKMDNFLEQTCLINERLAVVIALLGGIMDLLEEINSKIGA